MMTIRSHDQFNTTIYGLDDRYRGIYGTRKMVLMNEIDIRSMILTKQVWLLFIILWRQEKGSFGVKNSYDIPMGCIATYFPECNVLIPLELKARKSGTPSSKSIKVRILQ